MPRPKKGQEPRRPAPSGKPEASRGRCSGCGQFRIVDGDVLAPHLTFVRNDSPRGGKHVQCPGAGKPPAGPVVRGALLS